MHGRFCRLTYPPIARRVPLDLDVGRTTIYIPDWVREAARSQLPPEESVSAIATRAVMERLGALEGCAHEVCRCVRCGAVVGAESG